MSIKFITTITKHGKPKFSHTQNDLKQYHETNKIILNNILWVT